MDTQRFTGHDSGLRSQTLAMDKESSPLGIFMLYFTEMIPLLGKRILLVRCWTGNFHSAQAAEEMSINLLDIREAGRKKASDQRQGVKSDWKYSPLYSCFSTRTGISFVLVSHVHSTCQRKLHSNKTSDITVQCYGGGGCKSGHKILVPPLQDPASNKQTCHVSVKSQVCHWVSTVLNGNDAHFPYILWDSEAH